LKARLWMLALSLASCSTLRSSSPEGRQARRGVPRCAEYASVPESLLTRGSALFFGDVHGSREAPEFFAEAVCHASAAGPLMVGLEIPKSEQARVDRYLSSVGAEPDRAELLAGAFWTDALQDGRRSQAMAALLERIRALRSEGRQIGVALFDVELAKYGPDRDERMAEDLARILETQPDALTMVYVGNIHARTTVGLPWDAAFKPMALHLRERKIGVRTLELSSPSGNAWMCYLEDGAGPGEKPTCGPHPWPASPDQPLKPGVWLKPKASGGFDGVFAVTSLSVSPPATAGRAPAM
jgi:hypothetical protein